MYEVLYRYLIKYKKIDIPGIGMIVLQTTPAKANIAEHSFLPPKYFFELERVEDMPSEKLFSWLSSHLSITEQEAVIRFNEFVYDTNRKLKEGKQIDWPGVGVLQKEFSGEVKLIAAEKKIPWLEEVKAKKVTRQNAEHTVLVGETEKTSTEMNRLLQVKEEKNNKWWVWPLAIILAAVIFICWHFSETSSAGNNYKISPAKAPAGYNLNS